MEVDGLFGVLQREVMNKHNIKNIVEFLDLSKDVWGGRVSSSILEGAMYDFQAFCPDNSQVHNALANVRVCTSLPS